MNRFSNQVNPFRPGTGALPPFLAGRKRAKAELEHLLSRLTREGRGAGSPALLIGPRGSGKTALIAWLEEHAGAHGADVVRLTPNFVKTSEELAGEINKGMLSRLSSAERLEIGGVRGGVAITQGASRSNILGIIETRAKKRPLVLVIDEVHELDADLGCDLLNAEQIVKEKVPFMLVLAGTPNSEAVLNSMHATFWDRCVALGIGLLSFEECREAIDVPLSRQGISLADSEVWDRVWQQVQGFPYFVQLMGSALWETARRAGTSLLGRELVTLADSEMSSRKVRYYGNRRRELERLGLMEAAAIIAREFEDTGLVDEPALRECLPDTLDQDEAVTAINGLAAQGYIWMPPERPGSYLPGIPSLMRFLSQES